MDVVSKCLLGAIWAVNGALITFNPPPRDVSRAATVPWLGAAIMLGGICYIALSLRKGGGLAQAARRDPGVLAGGLVSLWWGLSTRQRSVLGMAWLFLGTMLVAFLNVIAVRIWGNQVYPHDPAAEENPAVSPPRRTDTGELAPSRSRGRQRGIDVS